MNKLIKGARYSSRSARYHRRREALSNQLSGHSSYPGNSRNLADDWARAGEIMHREDPEFILQLIMIEKNKYNENDPRYGSLKQLSEEYLKIPLDNRVAPVLNEDFRKRINNIIK